MARFTTDFLTWLKGLFHTKTEINTLLDKKINTVDVQGKITSFTNKDRINIERLINYMENGSGSNYYTLTLRATPAHAFSETVNNAATTANLGVTNGDVASADNKNSACFVIDLRKNGAIQKSSLPTITLKSIDGTKILEFEPNTFSFNTASGYKYDLARNFFGSTPGIHYVYAEATISGSVYKSNILGVFVKDTNNLLDYNVWSGGEYENNTTGLYRINTNTTIISSNEQSHIGEQSFKINVINDSTASLIIDRRTFEAGTSITYNFYMNCVAGSLTLRILELTSGKRTDVNISGGACGMFSLSRVVSSSQQVQLLIIPQGTGALYYIDNIGLKVS